MTPPGDPLTSALVAEAAKKSAMLWVQPADQDHATAAWHVWRLNSPDGDAEPARWAAESTITRLVPTGEVVEAPGAMSSASHAAVPVASAATTRGALPFMIGRRARRRR